MLLNAMTETNIILIFLFILFEPPKFVCRIFKLSSSLRTNLDQVLFCE